MSLPQQVLPTCFSMCFLQSSDYTASKFLYLRGGHAKIEDYTTFGETDSEALTSSMHTRFYLVPSKNHGDEQLWHIKCSYNNKYLVAKEVKRSGGVKLLVGTADELDEELSKPSCTLFKVKVDDHWEYGGFRSTSARFFHPLRDTACFFLSNRIDAKTGEVRENLYYVMFLMDVAEQIILPPYVAFKGDNGLYLRVEVIEGYLEFASKDKDTSATFTTLNYADGRVCIKSELNGKFLGLSQEWIRAESSELDGAAQFRAVKCGDLFALQNLDTKLFWTTSRKGDRVWLQAGSKNITDNAKLTMEEPVLRREIYNIEYHRTDHARIYDTTDMSMATAVAINETSGKNTVKSSMSITTTASSKHESTSTHKTNVSLSITGGLKLFSLVDMKIQAQAGYEYTKANTWGEAWETEKKQEIEYEVTVPANKKVTLTVTAKQVKCNVPFSYTQKDMLLNGDIRIDKYDDGLYTGVNCFDLRYQTKEEEIDTKEEESEPSKKRKGMAE